MSAADGTESPRCGAKKRDGGVCKLKAGQGTDHVGAGACSKHGGLLPGPRKAAARELALAQARDFGLEVDTDPLTAMVTVVGRAQGANDLFLGRVIALMAEDKPFPADHPDWIGYMATMKQLADIARMASVAGVAERQIRLHERLWDTLTAAYEDGLARAAQSPAFTPEIEAALREGFTDSLRLREGSAGDVIEGSESG
jgi:hypothetical protein